ncbi:MAG TPA: fumarylacetoacetate hydrolase family protein [Streptosporangiaceae bacterium]|jgi:2-keto-4-pentenoate hydratase/2-oxohepta-3-ene-1,7-dioic acid hydratase in catechol pathway
MDWFGVAAYQAAHGRSLAVALDHGGRVVDLAGACAAYGLPLLSGESHPRAARPFPGWPFPDWTGASAQLAELAAAASADPARMTHLPDVTEHLLAPPCSGRTFAAASNYVDHAEEMGTALAAKADSNPYMFIKPDTCLIGPRRAVELPPRSSQVDWEVELAVVIARTARHVSTGDALGYIAGYTVINDISARDLNVRSDFPFTFDWFQGKGFDTFAPLGPWLVPAALIEDPQRLRISLSVNGEVMQDATTAEMIFTVAEQISYLSSILTLHPGDVIASGTPDGVGMGRGIYLKPGDVMTAEIEGIGQLVNPVVTAPVPVPGKP